MTLRIGLITSEFPPDHGGVETYAWQLARELGTRPELHVTVFAPHKAASVKPPPGVIIKPVLSSCQGLDWAKLRNEPIDVWHALSAAHAWIAEKGVATVVSVHGNDFLAPYPRTMRPALNLPFLYRLRPFVWRKFSNVWYGATQRMLKRALPRADAILANSQYTADALIQRFPACEGKVEVAWVGVDPLFFDVQHTERNSVPQLLTVSRLSEPRKNVDRVITALAELKERFQFRYTIAGDGVQRSDLEQLVRAKGLDDRVVFVGRVSDAALHMLYSQADLFILTASVVPGSHEGFGIVYLEAAASGVPSLAARLAGAAEAVKEEESGFFVESPDVESLRAALERFLAGQVEFDAERCRGFARRFSWGRVADACQSAYMSAFCRTR